MLRLLGQIWRASHGTTAIECGLIAGLLALVLIASLTQLGTTLNSRLYSNFATKIAAT